MNEQKQFFSLPENCDYKNLWGLMFIVLLILGFLTLTLHQSLIRHALDDDRNFVIYSFHENILEKNVQFLKADSAILYSKGVQSVLLDNKSSEEDQKSPSSKQQIITLTPETKIILDYSQKTFFLEWKAFLHATYMSIVFITFLFMYFICRFRYLYQTPLEELVDNLHHLAKKEDYQLKNGYTGLAARLKQGIELVSHEIEVKDHALSRQIQKWQDALSEARNQFIQARLSKEKLEQELIVRKIFEEKIQAIQSHLNGIINSIPSIIIGLNHSLKITEWNSAAEQFTGVEQNKALGKSLMRVFPRIFEIIGQKELLLQIRDVHQCPKTEFETDDQRKLFIQASLYPLSSDNSGGVVIRLDDLTTQCRLEDIMVQTEKMMSVGGLAAGMAHEINNPLGGILQSAQNIQRRVNPSNSANMKKAEEIGIEVSQVYVYLEKRGIIGFVKGIRDLAERAATIVQNMLQFSRASDQKLIPADIADLINRSVNLATSDYDLKKNYDFKRIEIYREFDNQLPMVPCSPPELEQVILNLVKNAAQAMFLNPSKNMDDTFMITLRTFKEGTFAVIEVQDTGPGMPSYVQKKVFEPFFTTKEVGVGTGLGLSVSNFIIKNKHKGHMSVESQEGQGTTFIIKIPLEDQTQNS